MRYPHLATVDRLPALAEPGFVNSVRISPRSPTVAANASWFALSRALVPGTQLVLAAVILASGDVADYGRFASLVPIAALAAAVAFGWLAQAAIRYPDSCSTSPIGLGGLGIGLLAVAGGVAFGSALVVIDSGAKGPVLLAGLSAVTAVVISFRTVLNARLEARTRAKDRAAVEAVYGFGLLAGTVALWAAGALSTPSLLMVNLAGLVASLLCTTRLRMHGVRPHRAHLRSWAAYGFPISLWLLGASLYQFSDRWIVLRVAGAEVAGVYSLLYDLSARLTTLAVFSVGLAYQQRIFAAFDGDRADEGGRLISEAVRNGLRVGVPLTALSAAAGAIVAWFQVLDVDPPAAAALVTCLCLAGTVFSVAQSVHKPLQATAQTSVLLAVLVVSVAVNVVMTLLTVRSEPLVGPAAATLLAALAYLGMVIVAVRRFAGLRERRAVRAPQ